MRSTSDIGPRTALLGAGLRQQVRNRKYATRLSIDESNQEPIGAKTERHLLMTAIVNDEQRRRVTLKRGLGLVAASMSAIVALTPASLAATKAKSAKTTKAAPKSAAKPAAAPAAKTAIFKSDLPSVTVLDLSNNKNVDLASFADGKRPSLIWFWAPH
jgi:hypothetical protein